ncbi:MAG: amidohydrolase family protein [Pirellulaceae bacterium]
MTARRQVVPLLLITGLAGFISVVESAIVGAGELAVAKDRPASVTLMADRVMRPDGSLEKNLAVVVRGGRIKRLGKQDETRAQNVRRFPPGTVLCPGLVDLFSYPGVVGQTVETALLVDPDASPTGVLDPGHPDFRTALESGITAVMVSPTPANLVSGVCVSVRTHVMDGQLDVLRDDGPLILAFGEGVWRSDRAPTSRAGAIHVFRDLLAQARNGSAHPRVNAVVAGRLDALIVCPDGPDLALVGQALGKAAKQFGVVHTVDAIESVQSLKGFQQPVVVGPYAMTSDRRVLLGAAALADAGIDVAFRGGFPEATPEALRMTAALAVRHGMDPAAARRAMTTAPATVAGVADRIGAIAPGKDADLVVFSDDPLRMDAKVLEVYVQGVRVYATKLKEHHHE